MRKSFIKRFKITKSGKLIRRKIAQGHCRINKTGKQIRQKRKTTGLNGINLGLLV